MKYSIFFIFFILSNSFTQAQITSLVYPPDGTELQITSCHNTDPLANEIGPNAIWDYSDLPGCEQDTWGVTFYSIEGSDEADTFPDANKFYEIAIPPSLKIRIYNNVNDSSWSVYGVKFNTTYFYCNGGETILQFPSEIDDTWSDDNTWIGWNTIISNPEYTIDGQGTLILPNATYENVIRVHSVRPDAVGLFTEETYTYYSPDYQYHLFHMLVDDESQYQPNPQPIITSTNDVADIKKMNISPNPADGLFDIRIELDITSKATISLHSSMGEKIISDNNAFFSNGHYTLTPKTELAKGIYFLQVASDGLRYTSKLIIQ